MAYLPTEPRIDGWLISAAQIDYVRRKEYHYNAWSQSLLDPIHRRFWQRVVRLIPSWIAPSALSLMGLSCNVIGASVTLWFAPNLTEHLPPAICALNGLCVFLYQTFDGIDGKQSYRNQCSEIEEYMDHAADGMSFYLIIIQFSGTLRLGRAPSALGMLLLLGMISFWTAHWASLTTRTLSFGRIDVTEVQWSIICLHIATLALGSEIWDNQFLGLPFFVIFEMATAISFFISIFINISMALGYLATPLEKRSIRIPRGRVSKKAAGALAVTALGSFVCITPQLINDRTVPTIFVIGLTMARLTGNVTFYKVIDSQLQSYGLAILNPWVYYILTKTCCLHCSDACTWGYVALCVVDIILFHFMASSDLATIRNTRVLSPKTCPYGSYTQDQGFYVNGDNYADMLQSWQKLESDRARFTAKYSQEY